MFPLIRSTTFVNPVFCLYFAAAAMLHYQSSGTPKELDFLGRSCSFAALTLLVALKFIAVH